MMAVKPYYLSVDFKIRLKYTQPVLTQNDSEVEFIVSVSDNGDMSPEILDSYTNITMASRRKDGTTFHALGERIPDTTDIRFELRNGELGKPGKIDASLQFYGNDRISTLKFAYEVEQDLSDEYTLTEGDAIFLHEFLSEITRLTGEINTTIADGPVVSVNGKTGSVDGIAEQSDLDEVAAQLAEKVGGQRKAELEDLSPTVLGAIEGGEGVSFNLTSIPQDRSGLPEKMTFLKLSSNLYDKRLPTIEGKAINPANGTPFDSSGKYLSDFIRIEPTNTQLFMSDRYFTHFNHAFFDEFFVHIPTNQADNGTNHTKNIPSNAKYVRVTFKDSASIANAMLVYGSYPNATLLDFVPYKVVLDGVKVTPESLDSFSITKEKLDYNSVTTEKTDFIKVAKDQLFDKNAPLISGETNSSGITAGQVKPHATRYVSDFIKLDRVNNTQIYVSSKYFIHYNIAFYDRDKNVLPFTQSDNGSNETKTIPDKAEYVRVTLKDNLPLTLDTAVLTYGSYPNGTTLFRKPYRQKLHSVISDTVENERFNGKKAVIFGDSVVDLSEYYRVLGDRTGLTVINGAFGGTRAAEYTTTEHGKLSFHKLTDAIVSGDWTEQDAAVAITNHKRLGDLKAVNWNEIDFVFVAYGTNDYTSNSGIGDGKNMNVANYDGAINYGMDKLFTAYPHLKLVLISPTWRARYGSVGDGLESDIHPNGGGKFLYEYVESLKEVGKNLKAPVFDMYYESGINKYNYPLYISDGLHLNTGGDESASWYFGNIIASKFKSVY